MVYQFQILGKIMTIKIERELKSGKQKNKSFVRVDQVA